MQPTKLPGVICGVVKEMRISYKLKKWVSTNAMVPLIKTFSPGGRRKPRGAAGMPRKGASDADLAVTVVHAEEELLVSKLPVSHSCS